jgi:mannonate dehydratase
VVPVAEEVGVKLALDPDDPPLPPVGGIASLLAHPDDHRRAMDLVPSKVNGIAFCQGCFAEMGGERVHEEMCYFAERNKIYVVLFRNRKGDLPSSPRALSMKAISTCLRLCTFTAKPAMMRSWSPTMCPS